MSLCGVMRSLTALVVDAVEAVYYTVCDFDRAADEIWNGAGANTLADKEAEEEAAEPCRDCGCRDLNGFVSSLPGLHRPHCSSSPASTSAGDDPPSRSVPAQDVEREGLQTLTAHDLYDAASALRHRARHAVEPKIAADWARVAERFDDAFCAAEKFDAAFYLAIKHDERRPQR